MAYDPVYAKAYRKKNAEKIKARNQEYEQRPEVKARKRARINATPYSFVRHKVLQQKSHAKERGIVWELDVDATIAKILRQGRCKLSGQKFVYKQGKGKGNKNLYAPSIDRIDSRKGYVPGNIMFVCWQVNCAKQDMSLYQFKKMCAKVAK